MTTWMVAETYSETATALSDDRLEEAIDSAVKITHAIISGDVYDLSVDEVGMWWASGGALCCYGMTLTAELGRRRGGVDPRHAEFVGHQYHMVAAAEAITFPVWISDPRVMSSHRSALADDTVEPMLPRASINSSEPWWPAPSRRRKLAGLSFCDCGENRTFVPMSPGTINDWWNCSRCDLPLYPWLRAMADRLEPFAGEGGSLDDQVVTAVQMLNDPDILLNYTPTSRISNGMFTGDLKVLEYHGPRV